MIGAPYLVNPAELEALGVDPKLYAKHYDHDHPVPNHVGWAWVLDRTKDATLISRLQAMHEPHRTVQ